VADIAIAAEVAGGAGSAGARAFFVVAGAAPVVRALSVAPHEERFASFTAVSGKATGAEGGAEGGAEVVEATIAIAAVAAGAAGSAGAGALFVVAGAAPMPSPPLLLPSSLSLQSLSPLLLLSLLPRRLLALLPLTVLTAPLASPSSVHTGTVLPPARRNDPLPAPLVSPSAPPALTHTSPPVRALPAGSAGARASFFVV
jgi:hypothetical protein